MSKRAKEFILAQIRELPEIDVNTVAELIAPHCIFDLQKAKEEKLRKKAHELIRELRDETGVRSYFSCDDPNRPGRYVNVDRTMDITALLMAERQISLKMDGARPSREKIRRNIRELTGQWTE
jgi:hypothetical protein